MHSEFPSAFSQTFCVRYDECGAGGAMRAAVHLRLFQEAAFGHSAAMGFPLAWYEQHRFFWVVRRLHLIVHAPAQYGDALIYTTAITGARRVMARRRSTAQCASKGTLVATCITDWIFTRDGVHPMPIAEAFAAAFPGMTGPVTPAPLGEPPVPERLARASFRVRVSDVDGVGHVNNPVYLDLLDDAVIRSGGGSAVGTHPRTYDLQYRASARAGDPLQDLAWTDGTAWHYRLERPDGDLLLHGRLVEGAVPIEPASDRIA
jgi:acyl-CoA thioesterase FadM